MGALAVDVDSSGTDSHHQQHSEISSPPSDGSANKARGVFPRLLPSLPEGRIWEVWCGSEFTVACSDEGDLWSTGWNEHGNLGVGEIDSNVCVSWRRVRPVAEDSEADASRPSKEWKSEPFLLWAGALACGGGHCVALINPHAIIIG
jgi:hypothetical protein